MKYKVEGMKELENTIRKLGKIPQSCVTKAARKGANIPFKTAKQKAPEDTGLLKKGLMLKGEKSRFKAKKVYQVTFNPAYNDFFAKVSKEGKRAYYPASQEYGFKTVNGRYIPGFHYLKESIDDNARSIEKTIVDVLAKELDKLK